LARGGRQVPPGMSSPTRRPAAPSRTRTAAGLLRAVAIAAGLLAGSATASTGAALEPFAGRPEVEAFVDRLASEHGFAATELRRLIASLDPVPSDLELWDPPAQAATLLSLQYHRQLFVNCTLDTVVVLRCC